MRYAVLCGEKVSALGFGAMRLPRLADGSVCRRKALSMVKAALAGGVNYFDTGYTYHGGESEAFLRDALSKLPRGEFFLADKMPVWLCRSPADVERIFAQQLERCGTEYFDFYLAHSLDGDNYPAMVKSETYSFLARQKAAGRIKHLGFSFHGDPALMSTLLSQYEWDFVQIELNYLDWTEQDAETVYGLIRAKGLPIVVMEPLRGGFLANLPEAAAGALRDGDPSASQPEIAFRWLFRLEGVSVILSGMSESSQLRDNLRIFDMPPLPDTGLEAVERASAAIKAMERVPCTGCAYCMPCPAGVDIPGMLKIYNSFLENRYTSELLISYLKAPAASRAENCTSCGACASVCPQSIEAGRHLRDMAQYLRSFH